MGYGGRPSECRVRKVKGVERRLPRSSATSTLKGRANVKTAELMEKVEDMLFTCMKPSTVSITDPMACDPFGTRLAAPCRGSQGMDVLMSA